MIEKVYPISTTPTNHAFFFVSSGPNGDFLKVVEFENIRNNEYRLSFGDYIENGETDDLVISNNGDWRKIIETVAFCVVEFTDYFPSVMIGFKAVDGKRASLYNYVFRKQQDEIENLFTVQGLHEGVLERYNPKHFYELFVLKRKKKI